MKNEIRYAELFGGVGGFRLGIEKAWNFGQQTSKQLEHLQHRGNKSNNNFKERWRRNKLKPTCVFYNDNDKYAVQTYNKNFGENWEATDITTIKSDSIPDFDMLCAGFPCQAFSIAGKRRGFKDTRGTLFFEIARIVKAKRPKIIWLENVKGLLNHQEGQTFSIILNSLWELGYDVQWMVLNSKFFGVPQNRERVFIIASLRGTSRPEILPFRENAEEVSRVSGGEAKVFRGRPRYIDGKRNIKMYEYDEMPTLSENCASGDQKNVVYTQERKDIREHKTEGTPTLKQRMGTGGNNVPMVARALDSNMWKGTTPEHFFEKKKRNIIQLPTNTKLGYDEAESREDGVRLQYPESATARGRVVKGSAQALQVGGMGGVNDVGKLRRLTPIECERLQGFPDNWTEGVSDTQRYKQMGNAVTVNVIEAIARKLTAQINCT